MQKLVFLVLFIFMSFQSSAQFRFGAGINLLHASEYDVFGISVQGQYAVTTTFIPQASFSHFASNNISTLDLELRYKVAHQEKSFTIDPIAGFSFISFTRTKELGISLGGYMTVNLHDCTNLYIHPKLALYDDAENLLFLTAGILF